MYIKNGDDVTTDSDFRRLTVYCWDGAHVSHE